MATVRLIRGRVERPIGDDEIPPFELPLQDGERVLTVDIRGGHVRNLARPAVYTYTAVVIKETPHGAETT